MPPFGPILPHGGSFEKDLLAGDFRWIDCIVGGTANRSRGQRGNSVRGLANERGDSCRFFHAGHGSGGRLAAKGVGGDRRSGCARQAAGERQKAIASAKDWIAKFKTAGGKDIYIVVSLAGLIQGAPGGMIIPLNGADPAGLAKVVNPHGNPPPADPNDPNAAQQARMMPQTAVVGDNIVFSTGSGLEKMKTPSTEARQDLTDGLAAGGDSTVHLVLTPATLKNNPLFAAIVSSRMGGQNAGAAPQQPPFSEPQWDAVTWMSVSLTAPPKASGNCTIQCKDSDSASALSDLINKKMEDAKSDPTKRGNIDADDFDKLITAVKPAVSGTQVVISLDQDTIDNVIGPILTKSMQSARPAAAPPPTPADNGGM